MNTVKTIKPVAGKCMVIWPWMICSIKESLINSYPAQPRPGIRSAGPGRFRQGGHRAGVLLPAPEGCLTHCTFEVEWIRRGSEINSVFGSLTKRGLCQGRSGLATGISPGVDGGGDRGAPETGPWAWHVRRLSFWGHVFCESLSFMPAALGFPPTHGAHLFALPGEGARPR